jgi:hypothetical protein
MSRAARFKSNESDESELEESASDSSESEESDEELDQVLADRKVFNNVKKRRLTENSILGYMYVLLSAFYIL